MKIGDRLKKFRKEKDFTLKQLSDKSGLSVSFLSDIERNERNPSIENLEKIAEALDVTAAILLEKPGKEHADPQIRAVQRGMQKMTPKERKKMLDMLRITFDEVFDNEENIEK